MHKEAQRIDAPAFFTTHAHEHDPYRRSVLEAHGFVQLETGPLTMVRLLDKPIAEPAFPEGCSTRSLLSEDEVEDYVALHREGFGTSSMIVEQQFAATRAPDDAPDLDLVVLAPDSRLALFCPCTP